MTDLRPGFRIMICFQALAAIVAIAPPSYGGVACNSVRAAISANDADAFCNWYPFAKAYSDRYSLRYLVACSISKTGGRLQSILISRLVDNRVGAMPFVPVLIQILQDKKSKNRSDAAFELGSMGPLAKAAIAPLKHCLKSDDEQLRSEVCIALWRIERRPGSIIPTLMQGLSTELFTGPVLKCKLKFDGGEAFEVVLRPKPAERFSAQFYMLSAIRFIGPAIRPLLWPAIYRLRNSPDARVRNMVCTLAPKFCPDKGAASRVLGAELANHGMNFSTRGNFKQLRGAGVPELSRLVLDPATRLAALDVLTSLGKDGASAAKLVGTYKDDPDEKIRTQARAALEAFGKSEK